MAKKKTVKVESKAVTAAVSVTAKVVSTSKAAAEPVAAPVDAKSAILESANIVATPVVTPSHEAIARRAYEVYRARNGAPGNAWDDWCQAERELLAAVRTQTASA